MKEPWEKELDRHDGPARKPVTVEQLATIIQLAALRARDGLRSGGDNRDAAKALDLFAEEIHVLIAEARVAGQGVLKCD